MFVRNLETLEREGMPAVLDRLEAAGIRNVVLGDLWFADGTPAFAPNPDRYRGLKHAPPALPAGSEGRAATVAAAVRLARERGFGVYQHDWGHTAAGDGMNDPESSAYAAARTLDTLDHFPEISGFITDGPEWGYEIEPDHRQNLFRPFSRHDLRRAEDQGYDVETLVSGVSKFRNELRHLSPERVRLLLGGGTGFFDTVDWIMTRPAFLDWMRFREQSVGEWVGSLYATVKSVNSRVEVACGPRTAAFAPLAGYNFRLLRELTDFMCPKLYFWAHGIDGLKGTVYRWAKTLCYWNPHLAEPQAIECVNRMFGFTLPGVRVLADLERPLSREFYEVLVPGEISKIVLRAGTARVIRPWVGLHHGGVRLSADELDWTLAALDASPVTELIYWHYEDMQPAEWEVLRRYTA